MKLLFVIIICCGTANEINAQNILLLNGPNYTNQPAIEEPKQATVKKKSLLLKKLSLKDRFIFKWIEKKIKRQPDKKKGINTLAWASFAFGLLALIAVLIVVITDSETLLALLGIGFLAALIALILGIVALIKRSSLKDTNGTKAWPAITSIIFAILIGILLAIMLV